MAGFVAPSHKGVHRGTGHPLNWIAKFRQRQHSRPWGDLAVAGVLFVLLLVLSMAFDLAERWHDLNKEFEGYQIDEIPLAFTLAVGLFAWFAWRRWHDFGREVAKSEAARQQLQVELRLRQETERVLQEAQRQAEAADRAKSEFLANMSHELRTPLNATIGFAELMEREVRGPLGDPRYKEYVASIKESGEHLLSLINDILDISKIEAGKLELHEEVFDLAVTAVAAVRLVTPQAQKLRVEIETHWPSQGLMFRGDPRIMKQIMTNLLSNACKFSHLGGRITLALAVDASGRCIVKVRDDGIGMTVEEVALALQPFGRVDSYISRKRGGTGLGLPLVKALSELHGGSLSVESCPGKGTEVSIILPAERVIGQSESCLHDRAAG